MGKLNSFKTEECLLAFHRQNVWKQQSKCRVIFHYAHVYYGGLDESAAPCPRFREPFDQPYGVPMNKYRPIFASITALLFYTVVDILIWQRVFEANNMVEYAHTYHAGWFVSLAGYAVMGLILMWGAWKDCLFFVTSLFVGAFSGLEDVLYYVLDWKPMPDSLPWLDANPMIYHVSRTGVLASVLFWFTALALFYIALYWWRNDQGPVIQISLDGESGVS